MTDINLNKYRFVRIKPEFDGQRDRMILQFLEHTGGDETRECRNSIWIFRSALAEFIGALIGEGKKAGWLDADSRFSDDTLFIAEDRILR